MRQAKNRFLLLPFLPAVNRRHKLAQWNPANETRVPMRGKRFPLNKSRRDSAFESMRNFIDQCTTVAVGLFSLVCVIVILWQHLVDLLGWVNR
jgi:hypothetical protein